MPAWDSCSVGSFLLPCSPHFLHLSKVPTKPQSAPCATTQSSLMCLSWCYSQILAMPHQCLPSHGHPSRLLTGVSATCQGGGTNALSRHHAAWHHRWLQYIHHRLEPTSPKPQPHNNLLTGTAYLFIFLPKKRASVVCTATDGIPRGHRSPLPPHRDSEQAVASNPTLALPQPAPTSFPAH